MSGDNVGQRSLLVLYGTETGNSQEIAEELGRLGSRLRFDTEVCELDEVDATYLSHFNLCIFVVSTTGQGEVPRNARKFWRSLLLKRLTATYLDRVNFTIFGLGDSSYPKFNFAARKLRKRFLQLGAHEVHKYGEADERHSEGNDGTFIPWSVDLRNFLLTTYPLPAGLEPLPEDVALPPDWVLDLHDQSEGDVPGSPFTRRPEMNTDDRPLPDTFTATLTENARVTSPSHWQDVRQLTLTAPGPIPYGPGDILRIMPRNFAADVEFLISLMGWGKDADLPLKLVSGSPRKRDVLPSHPSLRCLMDNPGFTLRRLLTDFLDIRAVPRRSFFGNLSHFTNDTAQKERLLEFSGADYLDELYDYTTRPRRSILEILQEFDSVKLPWQHVLSVLPLLRSRQFSIASGGCQKTTDGGSNANFELLIAIVKYQTIIRKTREGVCTRYVASLPTGSTLRVQLERGVGLNISTKQLIQPSLLVGPGTGVAPLRAMLWEKLAMVEAYRARHGQDAIVPIGPTVLFFGGRGRENDYFYEREWEELREQLDLTVVTAFSRDQRQKIYVQDRIRENAETVGRLILEQMGTVYVCGSSGKMPQAVREALLDCLEKHEGEDTLDRKAAEEYLERMEKEGRYRQETW